MKEIQSELLQVVSFKLGTEEFGVDILKVQEINRMSEITRVPGAPDFVEGIINQRGKIITIIDLRKRLGQEQKEYGKETRIIVDGKGVGFIVDSVSRISRIPSDTIEPPPPVITCIDSEYIKGVGKLEDRLLILLDFEKILNFNELNELKEIIEQKEMENVKEVNS
ncbi:MAG: chemotaxis protein CheW [bacterium]